jgi:hypothetical protein
MSSTVIVAPPLERLRAEHGTFRLAAQLVSEIRADGRRIPVQIEQSKIVLKTAIHIDSTG